MKTRILLIATILGTLSLSAAASADTDGPTPYVEQAVSKLPEEKAENFRDTMQQAHEDNKDLYDQAHKLHEDMHAILCADTFDKDAFISKSEELRQVHDKIGAKLDDAFADAVSELSASERIKLARAMERGHKAQKMTKKEQEQ